MKLGHDARMMGARLGIGCSGHHLALPVHNPSPVQLYRDISDSDVRAIAAYLRKVRPVSNMVAKSTYKNPLPASGGATKPPRNPTRSS